VTKVQRLEGDTDHLEQKTLMQTVMETIVTIPEKEEGCLSSRVSVMAAATEAAEHIEELAKEDQPLRQVIDLLRAAHGDLSLLQASALLQTVAHQAVQPPKRIDRQPLAPVDKILKRLAKSCKESLSSLLRMTQRSVR
jgi:hypothetical protein